MAVHFKFRSAVAFDSIRVEANGITVSHLKEKIIEQKNLGRSTNFDLVITNAESGEEYTEDTFLVPKNTSVIIKRVPARRAKTTLLVNEPEDDALEQPPPRSINKVVDVAQLALTSTIDELYDMDDFGVDLYAVDESALTHVEADETSNTSAFLAMMVTDEKRYTQENSVVDGHGKDALAKGFPRGASYRAGPHASYVCHRCGLPGHFIQHCPTNGDPAYDLKKGFRLRADREDSSTLPSVVSQPNNLVSKDADTLPPELQCSLCQGIFKEAVMIPCCQYSFCDTCAREYLLEKGCCPQCGSGKLKSGDLLPNVALRQAIERFASAQPETAVPNEGAAFADVESATKAAKVLSPPTRLHKMSYNVKDLTRTVVVDNQPDLPVVDDSVCESAIGTKEKVVYDGSKPVAFVGEASSVGKKKKKPFARPPTIAEMVSEHMTGKSRKVNKLCYACGSPDHIARNCTANAGGNISTQHGAFHPLGPVPRVMNPFGQDMFWPGPMPYGAPALPVGPYGPMPFGAPALPVAPYGVPSFTPPMYPNPQMHGFVNGVPGRMAAPTERPLSREEFMELQERERRRRLAQDRRERELSEERPLSGGGSEQLLSSSSEHSLHKQWPTASKSQGSFRRHDVDSNFSKETGSTKAKPKHSRKFASERVDEYVAPEHHDDESDKDLAFDDSRGRMYSHRVQHGAKPVHSLIKKAIKVYECSSPPDQEEGQQKAKFWGVKEEVQSKSIKHVTVGRFDGALFERHEQKSYVKHDGTRVSEAGAAEMLRSSRHRSKKVALEGTRVLYSDQSIDFAVEAQERHNHYGRLSDVGTSIEVVKKLSTHKHHPKAKLEMIDAVFEEGTKKKRKHKKHNVEGLKDASMENVVGEASHKKSTSKRHKPFHTPALIIAEPSVEVQPALDDIEESRWQMCDGLEDGSQSRKERSKRKHHRGSRSALQIEG